MTRWKRNPDEGWLIGEPSYTATVGGCHYFVARDYDDPEGESKKLVWHLHDQGGFLQTFDRLRDVKAHVG